MTTTMTEHDAAILAKVNQQSADQWTPRQFIDRRSVIGWMWTARDDVPSLTEADYEAVYLLGDGFGALTEQGAAALNWDWSHVRDSSPAAITLMAVRLREALDRYGWPDRHGT